MIDVVVWKGDVVMVPPSLYKFNGDLDMYGQVTLQGPGFGAGNEAARL
jgi:hypothetical protein